MWNVNLKLGAIWSVKSLNEWEESYLGMSFGTSYVFIISVFKDDTEMPKFTYLKVNTRELPCRKYVKTTINNSEYFIQFDELLTGDQRALNSFLFNIDKDTVNCIITNTKHYFNLKPIKLRTAKPDIKLDETNSQQRLRKFGIDIYVTENADVHISSNKQIILSKQAKLDIIYNSKTDEDIKLLCDKYHIYPMKAIREIRNRLVYQHKQREG